LGPDDAKIFDSIGGELCEDAVEDVTEKMAAEAKNDSLSTAVTAVRKAQTPLTH
jgi:hypothetical protein